jgi:hypothetical protein
VELSIYWSESPTVADPLRIAGAAAAAFGGPPGRVEVGFAGRARTTEMTTATAMLGIKWTPYANRTPHTPHDQRRTAAAVLSVGRVGEGTATLSTSRHWRRVSLSHSPAS